MSQLSISDKRRIVIAYDGTEDARKLFDWSIKNIVNPNTDHVILVSAQPRTGKVGGERRGSLNMLTTTPTRVNEAIKEVDEHPQGASIRQVLSTMAEQLQSAHISSEQHILWGDPKETLPKYTQKNKVDLLIVGSRGLGSIKSVILGSVSDRCVHECPCPVLVVRNAVI
ncbi:adenine nucleotide alpha hydrolases-like protein [Hesseltinella vesiculosa]|uniref:Adenine nucleotide alpha hydrolases-like protein n=1 Tax=Hesseltinella vesiculosa TaxID=101127 RepID=A0A1X2GN57_9FUNG|nr:adenine nucleotide alpha hydrolases-like protein [Hesseltinella vesiculosa]